MSLLGLHLPAVASDIGSALAGCAYAYMAWMAHARPQQTAPFEASAPSPSGHPGDVRARWVAVAAWALHAAAIAAPFFQAPTRFGFGPALSITAWLVFTVYLLESRGQPQMVARWPLAGLGGATVLLAWQFAGPEHRMERGWLSLHWVLGMAAYGMFGAAVVHAWLMRKAESGLRQANGRSEGLPLLALERLMFRLIWAGFGLLSATLLAGWWLAGQGVGAKIDHKTVFSMLAWLTFAALLLGNALLGWRGLRATRMVYGGTVCLFLAYVGSRFVLEVVLKRP